MIRYEMALDTIGLFLILWIMDSGENVSMKCFFID